MSDVFCRVDHSPRDLLRPASLSTRIETAFGWSGFPCKMVGGWKFFDRTEIKTLINYLPAVSHTGHTGALLSPIARWIIPVLLTSMPSWNHFVLTERGAEKAQVPLWIFIKAGIHGRRRGPPRKRSYRKLLSNTYLGRYTCIRSHLPS